MIPFDWRALDRLGSIWRTYVAKGVRIAPEEHAVSVNFPLQGPNLVSAIQTVTFPSEGQFVWYGTTGIITDGEKDVVLFGFNPVSTTLFEEQPNNVMVRIREGQNQKTFARNRLTATSSLTDGWAPLSAVTGIGQRPYLLPFPVFLNRFDFLEVQFATAAIPLAILSQTYALQLTFLGWKLSQ